jgi:hypothetical protein
MNNNACGLEFVAGADNNVYRESMARASTGVSGPAVCAAGSCAPNFKHLWSREQHGGQQLHSDGRGPCN